VSRIQIRRYAEAGATDVVLFPSGPAAYRARTIEVFAQLAREMRSGQTPITLRYARGPPP
jgi:hypothetical protein